MTTTTVTELAGRLLAGAAPPAADVDGLGALFRAWCAAVPYDTTRKLAGIAENPNGPLWGLDPNELLGQALLTGTGGTCFPLAAGFAALATGVGLDAAVHIANPDDPTYSEHAVVIVTIDGARYLCDPAFLHLCPARLPTRDGQRVLVGPRSSPLEVTRRDGLITFAVQRGTSTTQRWYHHLDRAVDAAELAERYETAGRWAAGMRPYLRFARGAHQVVIDANQITTKGAGGLQVRPLRDDTLHDQLAAATQWVGEPLELLYAQISGAQAQQS